MNTAKSRISEVTVFSDRAQVSRQITETMTAGEHTILFDLLPAAIDQNSIQITGKGSTLLKDVKFKQAHYAEIPNEQIRALYDKKQSLEDSLKERDDIIMQAGQEKAFVDSIAGALTSDTNENSSLELDPEKWLKMVNYYRSKLDEINKEIRETEKTKKEITDELQKINREINDLGIKKNKTKNQVEVLIEVTSDDTITLELSYIVAGPSWYPVYDLRVSTEEKKMDIIYNAFIRQNTDEDWEDAQIKLSTAQPRISGRQPALSPWFVDVFQSAPAPKAGSRDLKKKAVKEDMVLMRSAAPSGAVGGPPLPEEAEPLEEEVMASMEIHDAIVETGATSVVFAVAGSNSVASDNQPHKVTILREKFNADFEYSTVPKLVPYAYLKAKVTNQTDFPFLPGESNVFLDNNFVAHSSLELISPSEEFWTFLGVDEGIKVEYKFLKKYHKKEGMISKKSKIIYEYSIVITNNKKTEEKIVLSDQIPITQNESIIVELIKPEYSKDTDQLKKNEFNYLQWLFTLKPGEKIDVPFVFSVEYPKDITVTGL